MKKRRMRLSLPKLSRGWRTVRNLAVVLICLYALWARAGYPLPMLQEYEALCLHLRAE